MKMIASADFFYQKKDGLLRPKLYVERCQLDLTCQENASQI